MTKRMKNIWMASLLFMGLTNISFAQQLAFPTAEGYGKYTRGGQ